MCLSTLGLSNLKDMRNFLLFHFHEYIILFDSEYFMDRIISRISSFHSRALSCVDMEIRKERIIGSIKALSCITITDETTSKHVALGCIL